MSIDVKNEINILKEKAANCEKSEDALRYSQAAVNLANVVATMTHIKNNNK